MSIWDPEKTLHSVGLGKRNEVKRATRVADVIRNELAMLMLGKIRDPKLQDASISRVEVTDDLKIAKIYFTIFGGRNTVKDVEKGFLNAKGFIRSHLARTLNMRYTPSLQFYYDKTADKVAEIENLLGELAEERKQRGEE